jgi:hypothetical protein
MLVGTINQSNHPELDFRKLMYYSTLRYFLQQKLAKNFIFEIIAQVRDKKFQKLNILAIRQGANP